jgi:microcystin-dependent protein
MAVVAPPTCNVGFFNPSCFGAVSTTTVGGEFDGYLQYPLAQGNMTFVKTDITGDAVFGDDAEILNTLFDGQGGGGFNGYVLTASGGKGNWLPTQVAGLLSGAVLPTISNVALEGFLMCDGTAYLQTDYPALYAVIGLTYTLSQPAGYFQVPALLGRTPIGSSLTSIIGTTYNGDNPIYGGDKSVSANQFPAHFHNITNDLTNVVCEDYNKTDNTTINSLGSDRCVSCNKQPIPNDTRSQPPYTSTNGVPSNTIDQTAQILPQFVAVNWMIKI